MKHYLTDKEEVLSSLDASINGLSSEEAAKRLERDGKNKLAEGKKVTIFQRIISQLLDPMVLVLIGAAVVVAQCFFCRWWLKSHSHGPFETLWRKLTWIDQKK